MFCRSRDNFNRSLRSPRRRGGKSVTYDASGKVMMMMMMRRRRIRREVGSGEREGKREGKGRRGGERREEEEEKEEEERGKSKINRTSHKG